MPHSFECFLRAVHRRHVALRIFERAAIGLLGACAIATPLVAVMLWRGQDAWSVAGMTLVIGTLVGAAWGLATRPSILVAASEADRQLRTSDLLGTAWSIAKDASRIDAFQQTVLALAAARCVAVSPSSIVLHRLGARTWLGIGLSVAFVATLAAMSSGSLHAETDISHGPSATQKQDRDEGRRAMVQVTAPVPQTHIDQTTHDNDDRPIGEATTRALAGPTPDTRAKPSNDAASSASSSSSSSNGAGSAKSSNENSTHSPPSIPAVERATSADGRASAGSGRAAKNAIADDAHAGGTLDDAAHSPAPWQSANWSRAVDAATHGVQSGAVPDDYRGLVRGYFDPAAGRR